MNNCNCDCNPCRRKCCPKPCGCPTQIMGITTVHEDTPAWLRFNFGGKSIDYDFTSVVKSAETDTSIKLDIPNRSFIYDAERHTDSFSASELGSILHIADIGDVDISGVQDNSLFVYQKNSDCGEGCESLGTGWKAINALDSSTENLAYIYGADDDGKVVALAKSPKTSQQYLLGWDRQNKLSYFQPREVATPPVDSDGYARQLWQDPETGEIVYTKIQP